ncbi:MAG: LysM peptidoglycan-binding domain-containing protein, partial [Bacteroidia bacterium]|nr:LysM peptidoglycan-binding domain-containing protein [Bacteroidia bacterium]
MSGELIKLRIKAYKDEKFTKKVGDGEFKTLLNPEQY